MPCPCASRHVQAKAATLGECINASHWRLAGGRCRYQPTCDLGTRVAPIAQSNRAVAGVCLYPLVEPTGQVTVWETECQTCGVAFCASCPGMPGECVECMEGKFLLNGQCVERCGLGYSPFVPTNGSDNMVGRVCLPCSQASCKSCAAAPSLCDACESPAYELFGGVCLPCTVSGKSARLFVFFENVRPLFICFSPSPWTECDQAAYPVLRTHRSASSVRCHSWST